MDNLLKGRLQRKRYHPKLSVRWLTQPEWAALFEDEFDYITIGNESAIDYYGEDEDKSYFVMFFTTQLKVGGKFSYLLMGAICELTSPEKDSLPDDFYMGKSLTIKSLINFGRLNEFIEPYDLSFDTQTMDADIFSLSQLKEFGDLGEVLEFAKIQKYRTGYMGHYESYQEFLIELQIKLDKEGII